MDSLKKKGCSGTREFIFFHPMHSSSSSKPGAYITRNDRRQFSRQFVAANVASGTDEEGAAEVLQFSSSLFALYDHTH